MRRVRSAALALILVIALTACRGGGGQEAVARGHSYSEDTIGTFVNQCIWRPRVTAAQCACLLEKYRTDFSEKEFLELLAKPATNSKAMAFDKACGIGSPVLGSATKSRGVTAPPAAAPDVPKGPIERPATEAEVCVQERLAKEMARSGGTVSVEIFDQVRAVCGG